MLHLFESLKAIGLELNSDEIKTAEVSVKGGKPCIQKLKSIGISVDNRSVVKQLDIKHPYLITGLESCDVLVRSLYLPLTKKKDIDAALAFQVDPLLPYPVEEAVLAYQMLNQNPEGSQVSVLSTNKVQLQKHLDKWQRFSIEPEKISCIQSALCLFQQTYLPSEDPVIVIHIGDEWTTGILTKNGKLLVSYNHREGFQSIRTKEEGESLSLTDLNALETPTELSNPLKLLQRGIAKICQALIKDAKGEKISGILFVGEIAFMTYFKNKFMEKLNLPLLSAQPLEPEYTPHEIESYALPIGLAIGALSTCKEPVDFRQHEMSYPHPWKRVTVPLVLYFLAVSLLSFTFYFFGQQYLNHQEDLLKGRYVELLAAMNKSYDGFEATFLTKNADAREKHNGEVVGVMQLDRDDLQQRAAFLQKDLQDTPDSFPLFANIPLVSDVLAWLSHHPYVLGKDENGNPEHRLQLESLTYTVVKKPSQEKKQEKYQVKVEFEFSSPVPKWAREFHDALIAPNDFVDPKGEVKWGSNRGHYRTSFYLKDKTSYPNF